jgi:hypothetical protein
MIYFVCTEIKGISTRRGSLKMHRELWWGNPVDSHLEDGISLFYDTFPTTMV